ncbi:MAG: hypothetical protein ACAH27_05605 [Xanthobacteraceae bacterium]
MPDIFTRTAEDYLVLSAAERLRTAAGALRECIELKKRAEAVIKEVDESIRAAQDEYSVAHTELLEQVDGAYPAPHWVGYHDLVTRAVI